MNAESIGWTNVKDYVYAFLDKENLITDLIVLTFFARVISWTCVIGISCHPPLRYRIISHSQVANGESKGHI